MTAYRGSSDKLKVTERFTRTGPDVLHYKFTVEDPVSLTATYSGELPFNRINENIFEYACHEGNYALPAHAGGARARMSGLRRSRRSKSGEVRLSDCSNPNP